LRYVRSEDKKSGNWEMVAPAITTEAGYAAIYSESKDKNGDETAINTFKVLQDFIDRELNGFKDNLYSYGQIHLNKFATITLNGTSGNNNSAACLNLVKKYLFGWAQDEYLTTKEIADREKKS
jgi:hypothetical protein